MLLMLVIWLKKGQLIHDAGQLARGEPADAHDAGHVAQKGQLMLMMLVI